MRKLFETQSKKFRLKFLYRYREIVKNWNNFTQLWRQWSCLFKIKILLTS